MSVIDWVMMAKDIGLDAIDLSIIFFPNRSFNLAKCLRRQINAYGMRVAMLTTYPDFTHPDPNRRKEEIILEEEAISFAIELGAELVRVTAGQAHPGTNIEEGINWAVEGLSSICEKYRDKKIKLVYENHAKPGIWKHTDFSTPPEIFMSIFEATDQLGLGINFDTANATAFAKDPLELLEKVIHRTTSVHAADTKHIGALHPVPIGSGITPFAKIFGKLKKYGWDGWICMEETTLRDRSDLFSAATFIRQTWLAS